MAPDPREQLERLAGPIAEPDRALVAGREPTQLDEDGSGELGRRAAERDELAQLVLGEQRVGAALGIVECAPRLALEGRDSRLEASSLGRLLG